MGFTGLEPILDKLASELEAHLPAKLDALEAALVPALTLPDVAHIEVGDRTNFDAYPAIALSSRWTDVEDDMGETRLDQHHVPELVLHVTSDTEANLERLLHRYVRAVAEVLADRRDARAFPFKLLFAGRRWTYSPLTPAGLQFLRTARMEFTCWRFEDRS